MTATITVPSIGDYNDSSDYINDILATFIKRFKEITNQLGIEYEQANTKDQILSNKLLVIGLCQVTSKMLKEKDVKRIKYLKKQTEILQEFDEYIDYLIKINYDFRNDFKLSKILIDYCEKLNMNKEELLKEYNTYKNN